MENENVILDWWMYDVHLKDGRRTLMTPEELKKELELDSVRWYREFW